MEDGFCKRYNSYLRHGELGEFHSKEDLLAVETGKDASVLFAALNSTTLEPLEGNQEQRFSTFGEIGNTQLNQLKQRLESSKQIEGHTRQLSVIGVPTLSAASNEVTPGRQYLVLRLGHKSLTTGKRTINLHSRIFNSGTKQWEPGVELTGKDIG